MPPPVSTSCRMHRCRWIRQPTLIEARLFTVLQITIRMAGQGDSDSPDPDTSIDRRVRAAYTFAWRDCSRLCLLYCGGETVGPPRPEP